MGTKIKWIALQTEMQQTLPWKMHATSSDSSSPLSGIGFILTSPDIWAHLRLSVLPALWSLTPTMATLLLDLTKQPNTRYLPSPFACCLHSPNLTTLKNQAHPRYCHLLLPCSMCPHSKSSCEFPFVRAQTLRHGPLLSASSAAHVSCFL